MAEESIALSAGQLLQRLQLTLVKDTTCPTLYWAKLQSLTMLLALEWHEALRKLLNKGFLTSLKQPCQWCSCYQQWRGKFIYHKVGSKNDCKRRHSLPGHMAEESIALSAGQLLRRLQLTLVKDTTCPTLYWAKLQSLTMLLALEWHEALRKLLNKGFLTSLKQPCQWYSCYQQWRGKFIYQNLSQGRM